MSVANDPLAALGFSSITNDKGIREATLFMAQFALSRYGHLELWSNGGIEASAGCRGVLERWNHRR
jgi:hypothetical protein